jgi:hypothetical protein
MPRPKKFSDEEILEKMLDLEKKSPDGTVSLSELHRALIKEEHGKEISIRKQSLSQRIDDKKRGKGLVQRGLVVRVGRRFKLTDFGRGVAVAYRGIKEDVVSGYIKIVSKIIAMSLFELYFENVSNIKYVLEKKEEEKKLPICYFLLAAFLTAFLTELRSIAPKVINEWEFERELKKLWEKRIKYSERTLKEIAESVIKVLTSECSKHIGEIFDVYFHTLLGIGFFNLGLGKITIASLKVHESEK